jgi:hypothetical protein
MNLRSTKVKKAEKSPLVNLVSASPPIQSQPRGFTTSGLLHVNALLKKSYEREIKIQNPLTNE